MKKHKISSMDSVERTKLLANRVLDTNTHWWFKALPIRYGVAYYAELANNYKIIVEGHFTDYPGEQHRYLIRAFWNDKFLIDGTITAKDPEYAPIRELFKGVAALETKAIEAQEEQHYSWLKTGKVISE